MKDRTRESLQAARVTLRNALQEMNKDIDVETEEWQALQRAYFNTRWRERVAADGFPHEAFRTQQYSLNGRNDYVAVFGSFEVAVPRNPTLTETVTVDHLVHEDGEVEVQVNGKSLDRLARELRAPEA